MTQTTDENATTHTHFSLKTHTSALYLFLSLSLFLFLSFSVSLFKEDSLSLFISHFLYPPLSHTFPLYVVSIPLSLSRKQHIYSFFLSLFLFLTYAHHTHKFSTLYVHFKDSFLKNVAQTKWLKVTQKIILPLLPRLSQNSKYSCTVSAKDWDS